MQSTILGQCVCGGSAIYLSLSDTDVTTTGCEDGSFFLYASYSEYNSLLSFITGIPLGCSDGQYTALCNDDTTDTSSAHALCTLYGYYGQLHVENLLSKHVFNENSLLVVN